MRLRRSTIAHLERPVAAIAALALGDRPNAEVDSIRGRYYQPRLPKLAKGERVSLEMKCPQCGHDNPKGAQFCSSCGADLNTVTARRIRRASKIWLVGGLMGLVTGLSFILVHDALTTDLMFDLWEFAVALVTPALIAALVAIATRSRIVILLAVAYRLY